MVEACEAPEGFAEAGDDCDDENAEANPEADEACDGADNNCDGETDEGVTTDFYMDADGDGFGAGDAWAGCEAPEGYTEDNTDCDDENAWASDSAAAEVCDGYDNNCDGQIDEGVTETFYADSDADGFGWAEDTLEDCEAPDGYIGNGSDCNDGDPLSYPSRSWQSSVVSLEPMASMSASM